jgi:ABC-2 type transport system permease protein
MDTPATIPIPRYVRWLPYWAVLQTDLRQTLRSWVWRTWVLTVVLASVGFLLYRFGVYREAKILQGASVLIGDLLRWTVLGSITLVVLLTVGSITAERGTLADSVLSRGISRYQYFLAKLHARLATVLATFLVLSGLVLVCSHFLLHEDLALLGCLVAVAVMAVLLTVVVCCGVTVGALCGSTVLGVSVLWLGLCAAGFVLSFLPGRYPTPDRVLAMLPQILRGEFDWQALWRMTEVGLGASLVVSLIGMIGFARSDV